MPCLWIMLNKLSCLEYSDVSELPGISVGKRKGHILNEFKYTFILLSGAACKVISIAFTAIAFFLYNPPPVQAPASQKNPETELSVQL